MLIKTTISTPTGRKIMNYENIKKLLKLYGASDIEIENFIKDLKEMPDVEEPRDEFDEDKESDFEL